ncbi:MAG: GNAT family N-acetyltransferase [Chloroflexota bacterium]|nr:GNAT family N-acetyltransferase [Dehalococcoidia bacterium]MEC8958412.1 GNAT family N-acetyltransferase [Chloroflexota bacterium]MEE3247918.1 GNAT family N-acetyltransferase [Chloroflexota bacterium]|tara:strand:- start:4005 stop:4508 length:504 start_codon:yes stop_codon:yes gene_type:complete
MKTANCIVETMGPEDWEAVKQIYEEGIATRNATVETDAPAWERWDSSHRSDCRLVAKDHDQIVGWAALSPVSVRDAYSGVAEVSVYVAEHFRGNGAGKLLLDSLISSSELSGVWTLQAMIFVENEASIALHTSCGFRSVGTRERIGCLYGHWRDTLLMERRSDTIGY